MIKKLILITFTFLLYFNSAKPSDLKIVYLDVDKIVNQSIAGKDITDQLKKLDKNNIKKFNEKKKKLSEEEKDILKKKNILSKEEFNKNVKILQENLNNFKKEINDSRREIDKKKIQATTKLVSVLNKILGEYSAKNSITLVIQKKNIIIGKSELDITSQILELLNAEIKNIKLK